MSDVYHLLSMYHGYIVITIGLWALHCSLPYFFKHICISSLIFTSKQWRTEGGGLGCSNPPRNSEDIGEVLDHVSKKSRRLDFLLQFTVFSYGCNLLNKGFF